MASYPQKKKRRPEASWSELPQDLLGLVIAGLTMPADRARFRAVCASWRLVSSPFRIPWVALPEELLMRCETHFTVCKFPKKNIHCVGTTDEWLAMDLTNAPTGTHAYSLHNFSSKTTMPLPELDAIIGGSVSESFEVRKVLMKSPPIGLIAVRTNSSYYPIILLQPGKGAWFPEPQTAMLTRIIDIAFLQDKLYGITIEEDLISLSLIDGAPTVTNIECVINHLDGGDPDVVSSDGVVLDDEDKDDEAQKIDHREDNDSMVSKGDETINDGYKTAFDNVGKDNDENKIDGPSKEEEDEHLVEQIYDTNDGMMLIVRDDNEERILVIWYLVESRGKLLMVRRLLKRPDKVTRFTRRVDVFEADMNTSTWVPLSGGLDGHALFISKRFSKSVSIGGDVQKDTIYFIDTGEAYNLRSKAATSPNIITEYRASCLFFPGSY